MVYAGCNRKDKGFMILRVGHLSTLYHTSLLFLSQKEEIEKQLGATLQWRLYGTGPAIIEAFEREEIDLAYIGLTPVIIGIERGVQIVCIAGGHVEGTVIAGISGFRGFPEIQDRGEFLSQFKNRRMGIPGKGSIHDVVIRDLLEGASIEDEIEIANFQWADEIIEELRLGRLQLAAGTPNLAVAIRRFLGGKVLWPPDRLWPFSPSYGIVVQKELLKEEELLKKFLYLHEEACLFLKGSPEEASKVIASLVGIVDQEFVLETLRLSPRYCSALTEEYIGSTMRLMGAMKRLGYIKRGLSREDIFYERLIRECHPSEGHY